QFNRATQARRQTGSAFKPVVYGAALDAGFTPSSLVLDAPFVIDQGEGQAKWKPSNSSNMFYGPSTLRLGLEKSRNLMTVRLAQYLKPETIVEYAHRLGLGKNMQPTLAAALGSNEATLLDMAAAYAMIVNGGYEIKPALIERIQDRRGQSIFRHDQRACRGCDAEDWSGLPTVPDDRKRVMNPKTAYQLVSMMEGVVQNGTGRQIRSLGIPLGGKTGTTNDWKDGWFIGFSPDLVVGVFVGFDQPRSMGVNEEGSAVAVPIFKDFMSVVLEKREGTPFRVPPGIRLVRVNADTGLPAGPGDKNVILEAFIPGTEPFGERLVLDGQGFIRLDEETDTTGIY
ncbi:MAG TPA: penicillin-binding transpeptidase domain-containing protein, partial [Sphingomonadales bacterium]|nr:penicillin-binding transpeptidase domain-containing protein [Sphingomonadales bacterium]